MGCMGTLRGEMRRGGWRSSRFLKVRLDLHPVLLLGAHYASGIDMLTAVDQPLDKLEDLTTAEMYVVSRFFVEGSD